MFNSLLNRKEKMGFVLFWWLIIVLSIGLGIQFYKWVFPEKFVNTITKTEYKYENLGQVELEQIRQGDYVKYGNRNLCVSSIRETRVGNEYQTEVEIYLRKEGECK